MKMFPGHFLSDKKNQLACFIGGNKTSKFAFNSFVINSIPYKNINMNVNKNKQVNK